MGMSATQARLLTITGRLTDNEMRSQTITNAKLRLAQKSSEASQTYMDALSSEKLVFKTYGDNGETSTYNLTPALLYSYEPLKNQYSIQNASGQNLVSATDAANFEASATLDDFLDKYGLKGDTQKTQAKLDYDERYAKYEKDLEYYNTVTKPEYDKLYKEWLAEKDQPNLYEVFSNIVGTSDNPNTDAGYCYAEALKGGNSCYIHLLDLLLDYDGTTPSSHEYTTTTGKTFNSEGSTGGSYGNSTDEQKQQFAIISGKMADKNCDGKDDLSQDAANNSLLQIKNSGKTPTEFELLKSDYKQNADGTYSKKTLKEKAIDLYYALQQNLAPSKEAMTETLINFTDGDMKNLQTTKPVLGPAPKAPDEPTYPFVVNDKDKGQWYINLWYMMNGSESANKVKEETNNKGETYFVVDSVKKNENAKNYKVIDDQLLTSNDWLTFALKNGVVTLSQASYFNPSVDSAKTPEMTAEGYYWNATAYSSTSDMVSVEDEVAIAKAEVKYKNTTTEIENQDKKYDQDLKKLDTEHNALQTEYESLKSVIDKNVERSFKAFS